MVNFVTVVMMFILNIIFTLSDLIGNNLNSFGICCFFQHSFDYYVFCVRSCGELWVIGLGFYFLAIFSIKMSI